MYFWDGHNLFFDSDATYGKSWGLKEFLDSWSGKLIIAGIECSHHGTHRLDEYCPYDAELMGTRIHGEGRETMEWMTGVLKPYIDEHFRTIPSREATAIGGSSMGGLISLYAVTMYNDVYSRAACVSPTLMIVEKQLREEIAARDLDRDTRIYLSWGTNEGYGGVKDPWAEDTSSWLYKTCRATANKVINAGGAGKLYCQIGGSHCEADWEKQNAIYMPFLWQE